MILVFEELLVALTVFGFLFVFITQVVLPQFYGKRWFPWFRKDDAIDRLSEARQRKFEAEQACEAARLEQAAACCEHQAGVEDDCGDHGHHH